MKKFNFIPGNLNQWENFKNKYFNIWLAGINKKERYSKIIALLSNDINQNTIDRIIRILGDQYGIVIFSTNWSLSITDYSRSFPLYWRIKSNNIFISPQAIKLKNSYDIIDNDQLLAFQMSGYTTNDGTLWKGIYNLNSGTYLLYKNRRNYSIKKYFLYQPWKIKNQSYKKFTLGLKREIDKIFLSIIKEAKGRTIIIPLSAGLDSRLIASGLKKYNYKKVKCFSYGKKNNYESLASKKIAYSLGYKWTFVEINHKKAKDFYNTNKFKQYLSFSNDGAGTSTIQGLYAIDYLLKSKFINQNNIIINGNSGDFISGGHIPNKKKFNKTYNSSNSKIFDHIYEDHFLKHYSLWEALKNDNNKYIIKKMLIDQCYQNIKLLKKIPAYSLLESLEFENRQTKYVVNCQRIYDYYNLDWLLPLWNGSFIKFWECVPFKYKVNQELYKNVLNELNYGGVWEKDKKFKYFVSPKWIRPLRGVFKLFFIFWGKKRWHKFEKKYFDYWIDNICGLSINPYFKVIRNNFGHRHYVSWLTLIAEKLNIGNNWQDN